MCRVLFGHSLVSIYLCTHRQNGSGQELFVSMSSSVNGATIQASVCVFSSLCQYFSTEQRRWSSEGLRPLGGSSPRVAHCLTQHLTVFGASMFVHPEAVILLPPVCVNLSPPSSTVQ